MNQHTGYILRSQNPRRSTAAAGPPHREAQQADSLAREPLCYCAGVPLALLSEKTDLLDQIARFAFDTLGAQQVELHVRDYE